MKQRKPRKKLNLTNLDDKLKELENKTEEIISNKGKTSPTQILLHKARKIILKAVKNKISYTKIAALIDETFNYKISPQTVKKFVIAIENEKKED